MITQKNIETILIQKFFLGNYHNVIRDCTTAIEILKPQCETNVNARALCIGQRGMALCKLGLKREGIEELVHSLKLKPSSYFQDVLDNYISN